MVPSASALRSLQKSTLINHQSSPTADATSACFDALGRSTHLADWQAKQTTMIYLHVMKRPGASAPSPLDFG